MIKNINLAGVWVHDIDEARDFYVDKLGFEVREDNLRVPGPPLDDESKEFVSRMLAKGSMGAGGLAVDDCRKTYEELSAKGVEFVAEPADRPYGVEAVMRDNSGNWWVLMEEKPFTAADFDQHP